MRRTARILLVAEVIVCFAPITLVLVLGVIITPLQAGLMVAGEPMALLILLVVGAGVGGLVALNAVVQWILRRPTDLMKPRVVRILASLGILALLPFATSWVGILPLICSAHLMYLARAYVFAPADPSSTNAPTA
jgi:hypothetical protein